MEALGPSANYTDELSWAIHWFWPFRQFQANPGKNPEARIVGLPTSACGHSLHRVRVVRPISRAEVQSDQSRRKCTASIPKIEEEVLIVLIGR